MSGVDGLQACRQADLGPFLRHGLSKPPCFPGVIGTSVDRVMKQCCLFQGYCEHLWDKLKSKVSAAESESVLLRKDVYTEVRQALWLPRSLAHHTVSLAYCSKPRAGGTNSNTEGPGRFSEQVKQARQDCRGEEDPEACQAHALGVTSFWRSQGLPFTPSFPLSTVCNPSLRCQVCREIGKD